MVRTRDFFTAPVAAVRACLPCPRGRGRSAAGLVVEADDVADASAAVGAAARDWEMSDPGHELVSVYCRSWERDQPGAACGQIVDLPERLRDRLPDDADEAVRVLTDLLVEWDRVNPRTVVAVHSVCLMDAVSRRALISAAGRRGSTIFPLLSCGRDGASGTLPDELRHMVRQGDWAHVRVSVPDEETVRAVAEEGFGVVLSERASRLLLQHTGGSPGAITDILTRAEPVLWQRAVPVFPVVEPVAERMREVQAGLTPAARECLWAAAVLGEEAPFRTLLDVGGCAVQDDDGAGASALGELRSAGLNVSVDDIGAPTVSFRRPMDAAAVRSLIPHADLARLHRSVAEVLDDPVETLRHRAASVCETNTPLAEEIRDVASGLGEQGRWEEAADLFLSAARILPDGAARDRMILLHVDALSSSGLVDRVRAWVRTIQSMADTPLKFAVLGYHAIQAGLCDDAEFYLDRAHRLAEEVQEQDVVWQVDQRRTLHGLASGDPAMMRRALENAPDSTIPDDSQQPVGTEAGAMLALSRMLADQPEADGAPASLDVREMCVLKRQRYELGAGWTALVRDDVARARRLLDDASVSFCRGGSRRITLWATVWLARTHMSRGNWGQAREVLGRVGDMFREDRMPLLAAPVQWHQVELDVLSGRTAQARETLSRMGSAPDSYPIMKLAHAMAGVRYSETLSNYDGVVEYLEPMRTIAPWREGRMPLWPWQDTYINGLVMSGELDRAEDFLNREFAPFAAEHPVPSLRARCLWASARLWAARGDVEAARRAYEEAIALLADSGRNYLLARVHFAFGTSIRRSGKRRLAEEHLKAARTLFRSFGAASYVRRCSEDLDDESFASDADHADPASLESLVVPLTGQERAVADLVVEGRTNREIAQRLFVSQKTVEYHLTNVYSKTGFRRRQELILAARTAPAGS